MKSKHSRLSCDSPSPESECASRIGCCVPGRFRKESLRVELVRVLINAFIPRHASVSSWSSTCIRDGGLGIPHRAFPTMIEPFGMNIPLYVSFCKTRCGTPNSRSENLHLLLTWKLTKLTHREGQQGTIWNTALAYVQ